EVYRPVLDFFLDRPAGLVWILGVTLVLGLAPLGIHWLFLGALLAALIATTWLTRHWATRTVAILSLVLIARIAEQNMEPLGHEFITPLNEGMVMDMPLTWPRASVVQSGDDLKARDMIFCRFPEVDMVVGKAGRAETASDPAPMDMIETMINFRPAELWPKRRLRQPDAEGQAVGVLEALGRQGLAELPEKAAARKQMAHEIAATALSRFDALMREYAYQRNQEFQRDLGPGLVRFVVELLVDSGNARGIFVRTLTSSDVVLLAAPLPTDIAKNLAMNPTVEDVTLLAQQVHQKLERLEMSRPGADLFAQAPTFTDQAAYAVAHLFRGGDSDFFSRLQASVADRHLQLWKRHVHQLDGELLDRTAPTYTRLVLDEILQRVPLKESHLSAAWQERQRLGGQAPAHHHAASQHDEADHAMAAVQVDPIPPLDTLLNEESQRFARGLLLWRANWSDLAGFGGELDRVMQMPGWTNVWTMPIQNRVDMLATGVSTPVGIRILGRNLEDVVRASEEIAAVVKDVPGAANVVAEPIRGKGYLEIHLDRAEAARLGANVGDISDVVEIAVGGKVVTTTIEGRERRPVRVRYAPRCRESEEAIQSLPVPICGISTATTATLTPSAFAGREGKEELLPYVSLSAVADVHTSEGPAKIKSENGLLRNYVNLTVRGRDEADWVEDAKRVVAERVKLPPGVFLEWTGQFQHEIRSRNTLAMIFPLVAGLIFLILWWTYHDIADAVLVMLAVPGALAGGVIAQWLFDYKFSVTVWVGYIACFGMATATGIIMLVYLREAVAKAGGLSHLNLAQLRQAVMDGAVHRLRPKLLTEGTCIIGLAPLLWATGPGADVIRPMVVPVLGGILIADEVIDLFLPVMFYWVRRRRWERIHELSKRDEMTGLVVASDSTIPILGLKVP
ncbi:MAG TPA: efflux RND transporter permease subunit, partial [Gemmataceae bacterium]|nr:efflux RND transporter permease subunit [Gemmataceae bacterium]